MIGKRFTVKGSEYVVTDAGPMGSGRFHGRQVVTLRAADGSEWKTSAKAGRVAHNARLIPA